MSRFFRPNIPKLIFVFVTGIILVSIITAVVLYAMYIKENSIEELQAEKIEKIFEEELKRIPRRLSYFSLIDTTKDNKEIVEEFEKIAKQIKKENHLPHSFGLMKIYQANTQDEKIEEEYCHLYGHDECKLGKLSALIGSDSFTQDIKAIQFYRHPDFGSKERIVGLDIASELQRHETIQKAIDRGIPQITPMVKLINTQGGFTKNSIFFYKISPEWVVSGIVPIDRLVNLIFTKYGLSNNYSISLLDVTAGKEQEVLNGKSESFTNHIMSTPIELGGREYLLDVDGVGSGFLATYWQPVIGFLSGTFFVIFLTYYIYFKDEREREIDDYKLKLVEAQHMAVMGHFTWRIRDDVFYISDELADILGVNKDFISLEELDEIIHPVDLPNVVQTRQDLEGGYIPENGSITFRVIGESDYKWLRVKYRAIYCKNDNCEQNYKQGELKEVFGMALDITEYKTLEKKINSQKDHFRELATIDSLTRVYNRVYFNENLEGAVARFERYKSPFSLIMVDIDHFKHINDTYGHIKGDMTIIQVAQKIKENIRERCCRKMGR